MCLLYRNYWKQLLKTDHGIMKYRFIDTVYGSHICCNNDMI